MASRLLARRQQKKKATTLVSKQTLEQAVQEAQALVEQLINSNAQDNRLDQLQEVISFLESVLKKSSMEMQQEGASTLDDYLDDAVMPEMAQKIKQDVDMIAKMKNAGNEAPVQEPVMASGSDNWVNDRDENGEPKAPELAEVPRLAAKGKKAAPAAAVPPPPIAPKAPAKPAEPSADITQLSSDTLAKMQKALAGSEDLMNDKAAQAFIAAIAEELMNRPVEQEAPEPAAPAAAPAMPVTAAFRGLVLAAEDEEHDVDLGSHGDFKVHEGDLHEALGIPKDQKIPMEKLHAVMNGDYPEHVKNMARSAIGLKSMHHGSEKVAVTPPGVSEELMHKLKKEYPGDEEAAYATAWKIHNDKSAALQVLNAAAKAASGQGGSWFVSQKSEGLQIDENGGRTPEIEEAHSKQDDKTGISRPATTDISKFAAGDMTTGKALKTVEKLGNELKSLYFEAKPVTEVLDSRPVREAVEAIYRAYDLMGEAAKVLNKQHMQEQAEEQATEIKNKGKKSSSMLFGLALAADEEDDKDEICNECGYSLGRCKCEHCPKCHQKLSACECDIEKK